MAMVPGPNSSDRYVRRHFPSGDWSAPSLVARNLAKRGRPFYRIMPDGSPAPSITNAQLVRFVEAYCETWDNRHAAAVAKIPQHLIAEVMSTDLVQRASLLFDRDGDKRAAAQMQRAEEVRVWLWSVMEDGDHDIAERIKAADKLMKSYGGYIHRVQVSSVGSGRSPGQRGLTDEQAESIRSKVLGNVTVLQLAPEGENG